jgi:hypothetical protein
VPGAGGQNAHQAEFSDAEPARGDGQGGQQPDECERGEGSLADTPGAGTGRFRAGTPAGPATR